MSAPLSDRVIAARDRITSTIAHPATSDWLRRALIDALERDPFDARMDAFQCFLLVRQLEDAVRAYRLARGDAVSARHFSNALASIGCGAFLVAVYLGALSLLIASTAVAALACIIDHIRK